MLLLFPALASLPLANGTRLNFQARGQGEGCDRIYTMELATAETRLVSTGSGRTTCSSYYPGADRILDSSIHPWDPVCPPAPDMSQGYVWALHPTCDILAAAAAGPNRNESHPGNTNVFMAEGVDKPEGRGPPGPGSEESR